MKQQQKVKVEETELPKEKLLQKDAEVERIMNKISERVEDTMVAQKKEETSVNIPQTKTVSGIMKREALESAKALAQAISKDRLNEWC